MNHTTKNTTSTIRRAGNPVFSGWYADPELHIFGNKYYIYPTVSAPFDEQTFFEVWSSDDLTNWKNEGKILDLHDVPWSTFRAAWAPSAIERDGKFYFYFSAGDSHPGDGAGIGVAVSDYPTGPFIEPLGKPLVDEFPFGAQPIDAHAFIDDDGQAYLYFGGWRKAVVVKLNRDMISLDGEFHEITPSKDYVEGSFMLKRKGVYYFMWSEGNWTDSTYCVSYARSNSPLGPFKPEGVIMCSNEKVGNGAGHHSVLQIPGTDDWYICYHRRPLGETDGNHRVTCIDHLYFNEDGSIQPVILTDEGVEARPLK